MEFFVTFLVGNSQLSIGFNERLTVILTIALKAHAICQQTA